MLTFNVNLKANFSILKPDKGNGIVVMNRSDYLTSVEGLFSDSSKFKQIPVDPTPSRLSSLQNYLSKLFNEVKSLKLITLFYVQNTQTASTLHCLNLDL